MLLRLITLSLLFTCLSWRLADASTTGIDATHPVLRAASLPALIPAEEFYGLPRNSGQIHISPDGTRLAWVAIEPRKLSFRVRHLNEERDLVMKDLSFVPGFTWALDSRHVLFLRGAGRDRNIHLFLADTDRPERASRDLTPFHGVSVRRAVPLLRNPDIVLVQMNLRDRGSYDLYQVNIHTGKHDLLARNDGHTADWIVNPDREVLARIRKTGDGGWNIQARRPGGAWDNVLNGTFRDVATYHANLLEDGTTLYLPTNAGRDKQSVIKLDLRTGIEELTFEAPDAEVSRVWLDSTTGNPVAVRYFDPLPRYHFYDVELREDLERVLGTGPVLFQLVNGSIDYMQLVLLVETDRQAPVTVRVDRRSGTRELLAEHRLSPYADDLSEMRPIHFVARDGLRLHGFLTLPKGTDGKRLPTVVKVHGGPWMFDRWGFDNLTQFLANRGYAVLAVNFRGSAGAGKAFMDKGRRELGRKMQDDLVDALDWAIAQGHTDPDRVAILGDSYGGYAALMAMALTPDKFAAGISTMGPTDLTLLVDSFRSNPEGLSWWLHFAGDTRKEADFQELVAHSPVTHASRIQGPLLLFHGGKDNRVSKEHFDRLLKELRKGDASLDYLVFPKEGHRIRKPANRLKFARRVERFLARHLGGRTGPLN